MTGRDELLVLVRRIIDPPDDMDESEHGELLGQFESSIPHPGGTDLLYYPQHWGLTGDVSPEDVVDAALSWVPRALVMRVRRVRPHLDDRKLRCYEVVVEGVMQTQVVAAAGVEEGAAVVVALSGCRLRDGTMVRQVTLGVG